MTPEEHIKRINQAIALGEERLDEVIRVSIKKYAKKYREDFLKERTLTISVDTTTEEVDVEGKHEVYPEVIKIMKVFKKALLVGPPGSGKSHMARNYSEEFSTGGYAAVTCTSELSKYELIGYREPDGNYVTPPFLSIYENGGVFFVDEYDAMNSGVALFFNSVLDGTDRIPTPYRDVKFAKRHEDFNIMFAGNTWGGGGLNYSGRDFQDKALMDRLRLCRIEVDYDKSLEKAIIGDSLYNKLVKVRGFYNKQGSYFSTRNMIDAASLINTTKDKKEWVKYLRDPQWERSVQKNFEETVLQKL